MTKHLYAMTTKRTLLFELFNLKIGRKNKPRYEQKFWHALFGKFIQSLNKLTICNL